MRVTRRALAGSLAVLATGVTSLQAQTFPARQVSIIVPYPAGGFIDVSTRLLAEGLRERWGKPVIVINKPGANGKIGLADLVRADPDGYTLLANNDGGIALPPALDGNFNFDFRKDYTPVAQVVETKFVIALSADVPAKTVAEFIAYGRANPGKLNYASPGLGTTPHIAAEYFAQKTGLKMVHVPYVGAAPAVTDLINGVVNVYFASVPSIAGHLASPRLRIIGTLANERIDSLPNAPTMAQAGVEGLVVSAWLGLFAPPKANRAVVQAISKAVGEVVADPKWAERFRATHADPISMDADAFTKFYLAEVEKWKDFSAATGIRVGQ
jgi:tripartite-type tricarboxylate transporter receptor subunit TctC